MAYINPENPTEDQVAKISRAQILKFKSRIWKDPDSGCWIFMRADGTGYSPTTVPRIMVYALGMHLYPRHLALALEGRPVNHPDRAIPRASCHPMCINPEHMSIKNRSDSTRSAVSGLLETKRYVPVRDRGGYRS